MSVRLFLVALCLGCSPLSADGPCLTWHGDAPAHCEIPGDVATVEPGEEWCPELCGSVDAWCRAEKTTFAVRLRGGCS